MHKQLYLGAGFILGAIAFVGFGVYAFTVVPKGTPEPSIARAAVEEFTARMRVQTVAKVGQPIEGFEPFMFLQALPGLEESDFSEVDAEIGGYRYVNGKIIYDLRGEPELHSAARAISDEGMEQLLFNVAYRLSIELEGEGTIDDVMLALGEEEVTSTPVGAPAAGKVTLRGQIVCLPHRDQGQFHTLECAFGLRDADGRYYALRDSDPLYGNVGNAPMNEWVEVEGIFAPEEHAIYESAGIIEVADIRIADTPTRISAVGTYVCLPYTDSNPSPDLCAYGMKTDEGTYYALDFGLLQSMEEYGRLAVGMRIAVDGPLTPVKLLSTDHWQRFPISGILSVTGLKILT